MFKRNNKLIVLLIGSIIGLFWAFIYLLLFDLHGMTEMFNSEFTFFTASIFSIEITTKVTGVLFSFIDGFIFGIIIVLIFTKLNRFNSE